MKKLALAFVMLSAVVTAQTKKVVTSDVNWWGYKVAKTEASSHYGDLKVKEGSVQMKNNMITGGTFVLDMNTINATDVTGTTQQKLNAHLKNDDFFEVDKYPTAVFKITSVKKTGNTAFPYLVAGTLNAKGKSSEVTFPARITMNNGLLTFASDKFAVDRQKWDISYQSSMKDVVVKNDIDLQINFTAK